MPNVIYDLAVRLSFTAPALAGPIASAIGSFGGLKRAAADAQVALDKLGVAHSNMPQVIYKHQAAVDALAASQINLKRANDSLASYTGPNSTASARTVEMAQQRVQMAEARANLAQMRLSNTPVPSVVEAGLVSNTAAAQAQLDAANAAAGRGARAQNMMVGGAIVAGAGLLGADVVSHWIKDAMAMQTAMEKVQLATSGTADQMTQLRDRAQEVSAKVQMSSTDVMNIALLAATSGFNSRAQLLQSLPTLANVAEIAQQMRGVDPSASVPEYVRMAHMFQQYGARAGDTPATAAFKNANFNQMLNLAARSLLVSGSTPAELSRVMQYLAPTRAAFNLPPEDIIQFASLAMNVGLTGGRGGGARLGRFAQQLVPTGVKRHDEALRYLERKAGANFTDAQGNLSTQFNQNPLINALDVIQRFNKAVTSPAQRIAVLNAVYGSSGEIAAMALANPGAIGRGLQINTQLGGGAGALAPVSAMQRGLAGVVGGQMKVLSTDITNISQNLGRSLLPALSKFLELLLAIAGGIMTFTRQHQALTEFIAIFTSIASAVAIVAGGIVALAGAWMLLAVPIGLTTAMLLPWLLIGAGVVAVVSLIIVAITHWSDIMKTLGQALHDTGVSELLGEIGSAISAFIKWTDVGTILGNLFSWMGDKLHGFLVFLDILHNGPPHATNAGLTPAQARAQLHASRQPTVAEGGTISLAPAPGDVHLSGRFLRHNPPPRTTMPPGKRGIGGGYGHAGTIMHYEPHYHISGPDTKTSNDLAAKIHAKSMNDLEAHLAQAVRNDTRLNEGLVMAYH